MQEAAKVFGAANNVMVNVVAGPTAQWLDKAKQDADIVFSGAENMMSDFAKALPGAFELADAQPLYLRPVAILVRRGGQLVPDAQNGCKSPTNCPEEPKILASQPCGIDTTPTTLRAPSQTAISSKRPMKS